MWLIMSCDTLIAISLIAGAIVQTIFGLGMNIAVPNPVRYK
jgi:hypothetical protein